MRVGVMRVLEDRALQPRDGSKLLRDGALRGTHLWCLSDLEGRVPLFVFYKGEQPVRAKGPRAFDGRSPFHRAAGASIN